METEILLWSMVAIVGTVGVGVGVAYLALKLPIKAIQVWVAVTGATLFYDTIFKAFEKLIGKIAGEKDGR